MTKIPDDYEMPFGKHRGEKIGNVPASYLDWLRGQDWLSDWYDVWQYIRENGEHIDRELDERSGYG